MLLDLLDTETLFRTSIALTIDVNPSRGFLGDDVTLRGSDPGRLIRACGVRIRELGEDDAGVCESAAGFRVVRDVKGWHNCERGIESSEDGEVTTAGNRSRDGSLDDGGTCDSDLSDVGQRIILLSGLFDEQNVVATAMIASKVSETPLGVAGAADRSESQAGRHSEKSDELHDGCNVIKRQTRARDQTTDQKDRREGCW